MYGISTYIYYKNQPNVGKYTVIYQTWMVWDSFHPGCWLVTHQDDFTKKIGLPGMANLNLEVFHSYWWGGRSNI